MKFDFDRVFIIGNLGEEYLEIGRNKKKYLGGSGFRFAVFSRPWFPAEMLAICGPRVKWSSILKSLARLGVGVKQVRSSKQEIKFLIKYNNLFNLKDFKIKNGILMGRVAALAKKEFFNKKSLLHICPLDFDSQKKVMDAAKEKKALISLQIHFTSLSKKLRDDYSKLFKHVNILFINQKEVFTLTRKNSIKLAGNRIASLCPGIVFITQADKEVYVYNNSKFLLKAKPLVSKNIVNVAGAGDAFAAGVIAGLYNFKDIKKALSFGLMTSFISIHLNSPAQALEYIESIYGKKSKTN